MRAPALALCLALAGPAGDGMFTTAPGDPAYVVDLAAQAGITVTVEQVTALLSTVDVSEQEPFAALDRAGLKMVQRPV